MAVQAYGTFAEGLELQRYPFDRQLLTLSVSSQHRKGTLMFVPHEEKRNENLAPDIAE